jgi:hypothetical protein
MRRFKGRRKLAIIGGVMLIVAVSIYFGATRTIDHLVGTEGFLRFVSRKTAVKLSVSECGYLPAMRRGMEIHSAGILARGHPPHHLTELSAINLHAYCSLENLWQRKFTIQLLKASQLQAAYGKAAAERLQKILPAEPNLEPERETESLLHIDIRKTDIDRTDVSWGAEAENVGGLKEVHAQFFPKDHGLDIFGRGGTFQQAGWPALAVDELHFNWTNPKLFVKSAYLSLGRPKDFSVTGQFDFGEHGSMQLHLSSKQAPAEPLVTGYWKGKFNGVLDSESDLTKQFVPDAKVTASGDLNFSRATVHDVEVLKKIAVATRHPQFEKPKIDILRLRYRWTGQRLEVSNFKAETKGLCRLEGEFSIENKNIDGNFEVGAAADVVDAIPGAREKVFTESRDGYLWTTLKLSGPADHPREDLKQRLVAAAQEHFAKGLLAPILKPGKALIDLLQEIYQ